tara:strand:+ start:1135 stop:1383 length:249 start_codon:yes stop_codon:yes gene_type:complete
MDGARTSHPLAGFFYWGAFMAFRIPDDDELLDGDLALYLYQPTDTDKVYCVEVSCWPDRKAAREYMDIIVQTSHLYTNETLH